MRDSDATLILCRGEPTGGTALTAICCEQMEKPYLIHDLNEGETDELTVVTDWMAAVQPRVLNIAGPREEATAPIRADAQAFLTRLLAEVW